MDIRQKDPYSVQISHVHSRLFLVSHGEPWLGMAHHGYPSLTLVNQWAPSSFLVKDNQPWLKGPIMVNHG